MPIDFGKIAADWAAMESALANGPVSAGLKAAGELVKDAGDVTEHFETPTAKGGGGAAAADVKANPKADEIKATIARVKASGAQSATGIGDPATLKLIVDALVALFGGWFS